MDKRFFLFVGKCLALGVALVVMVLTLSGCQDNSPEAKYKSAQTLMADGKYAEAAAKFEELGSYEEASKLTMYCKAAAAGENGDFDLALSTFELLGDYKESQLMIVYYNARRSEASAAATPSYRWNNWIRAAKTYDSIAMFRDSQQRAVACRQAAYDYADMLEKNGDQLGAYNIFIELGKFMDSLDRACLPYITLGISLREEQKWDEAVAAFTRAGTYSGAQAQIVYTRYVEGETKRAAQDWDGAVDAFTKAGKYSDAETQISATRYAEGEAKRVAQDWDGAVTAFAKAGKYSDAETQISATWYAVGEAKRAAQDWDGAVDAFTKAGKYSDAKTKIKETRYQQAKAFMEINDFAGAYNSLIGIKDYKDVDSLLTNDHNLIAAREAKLAAFRTVGGYVTFGSYEQDNNTGNGQEPIEWLVLEYDAANHRVLLLSRYGLDAKPYNTNYVDITWEKCKLRTWLNNDFMNAAFTAQEQKGIVMTAVDNSKSQCYSGWSYSGWSYSSGNNTQDRIFLLSYAEANKYLGVTYENRSNTKSRVAPTTYALNQGAGTSSSDKTADGTSAGWWWLRSPGRDQHSAADVSPYGSLFYNIVDRDYEIVRPALWINLESDIF